MYLNSEEGTTHQEQEQEIQKKLLFEIEWFYEQHGEIICIEDLVFYTEQDMKDEGSWTDAAFDYMEEIAEEILDTQADELKDQIKNTEPPNPYTGQTFYDRQI